MRKYFFSVALLANSLLFGSAPVLAQSAAGGTKPATANDINTYMTISIVTFCEARGQGISFDKSIPVALAGQVRLLLFFRSMVVLSLAPVSPLQKSSSSKRHPSCWWGAL